MLIKQLKRSILTLSVLALFFATTDAKAQAPKATLSPTPTTLTLGGSTGLINVASTYIANGLSVGMWTSTNFAIDPMIGIRTAFGFADIIEIFGGVDITLEKTSFSGIFGLKTTFFKGDTISFGLLGNIQFNDNNSTLHVDGQVLAVATWQVNQFKTSAVIGKSFGKGVPWSSFDFGMGAEWWFFNSSPFSMAWIFDFANYSYRVSGMQYVSGFNENRGIFSSVLRFSFADNIVSLDIGGTDLLDSTVSLIANLSTNIKF